MAEPAGRSEPDAIRLASIFRPWLGLTDMERAKRFSGRVISNHATSYLGRWGRA